MADKREDKKQAAPEKPENPEESLGALGPHIPPGESNPKPIESSGDAVTASEESTEDEGD